MVDADKMYWEKTWRKLHKNVTNYIEQIMEAESHEIADERPPTSYL